MESWSEHWQVGRLDCTSRTDEARSVDRAANAAHLRLVVVEEEQVAGRQAGADDGQEAVEDLVWA